MDYRLVSLDKKCWVHPVGIRDTLHPALTKLIIREEGGQAKTACGDLQLCTGLEASIVLGAPRGNQG